MGSMTLASLQRVMVVPHTSGTDAFATDTSYADTSVTQQYDTSLTIKPTSHFHSMISNSLNYQIVQKSMVPLLTTLDFHRQ